MCSTTVFGMKSMIYLGTSIQGKKIETDVVENFFSQVRARNGQNDNSRLVEYDIMSIHMENSPLLNQKLKRVQSPNV